MVNDDKLQYALAKYKNSFKQRWKNERFKWEAVKWFQDNWDINARNFSDMFAVSTEKTAGLLASVNNFPRRMLIEYAQKDEDAVRAMFSKLYDESTEVTDRIAKFQSDAQELCDRFSPGYQHYQRPMAITVYLWLKNPEKYDVFKFSVCKEACSYLGSDFKPIKGHTADNIKGNTGLVDYVKEIIKKDDELISLYKKCLDEKCYIDDSYRMLSFDFLFFITYEMKKTDYWIGEDIEFGITAEKWKELFKDHNIFNKQSWEILYRMYDNGGEATCTQLSKKYGENMNFYSNGVTALARRVQSAVGCSIPAQEQDGSRRFWIIMFVGRKATSDEDGVFVWKIRDELKAAIKTVDFSNIDLYAKNEDMENAELMTNEPYTKEDFLSEVYMEVDNYELLKGLLLNKKNVILQGLRELAKHFQLRNWPIQLWKLRTIQELN